MTSLSDDERRERIRESNRRSYQRNRARRLEEKRLSYAANPEPKRSYQRSYRLRNLEKELQRNKRYSEENAERLREYRRQWRTENDHKLVPNLAKARENARRRRAARRNNGYEIYTEDEVLSLYGTSCWLCGVEIDLDAPRRAGIPGWEFGLQVDHVILISKGGPDTLENVRPSHGYCNVTRPRA